MRHLPHDKELACLVRALIRDHGATAETTGGNHIRITIPGCPALFVANTPSDWRSIANFRARVRRALEAKSDA